MKKMFLAGMAAMAIVFGMTGCGNSAEDTLSKAMENQNANEFSNLTKGEINSRQAEEILRELKRDGAFDASGKLNIKKVKTVDDDKAAIAVYLEKTRKKPYWIFFMKKVDGKWILVEMEDDKSADGKQMTDSNIRYKCNR